MFDLTMLTGDRKGTRPLFENGRQRKDLDNGLVTLVETLTGVPKGTGHAVRSVMFIYLPNTESTIDIACSWISFR
jgi:hypothetical protein